MKNGHIFLNLYGEPEKETDICLRSGHGYYAYVNTNDEFVRTFFRNICLWGGSTNKYTTKDGKIYLQYEIDCRDKKFLTSMSFSKICENRRIDLTIFDKHDDTNIIKEFWNQMQK